MINCPVCNTTEFINEISDTKFPVHNGYTNISVGICGKCNANITIKTCSNHNGDIDTTEIVYKKIKMTEPEDKDQWRK